MKKTYSRLKMSHKINVNSGNIESEGVRLKFKAHVEMNFLFH